MTDRPLRIGISACLMHPDPQRNLFRPKTLLYFEQSIVAWVAAQGALPILLPTGFGSLPLAAWLEEIDGLLLQGGADVCPRNYGEEPLRPQWSGDPIRDAYEMELIHGCLARKIPILGVCRGHQLLNVALGGSLYQDIQTQIPGTLTHRDADLYDRIAHGIEILPDTDLARIYGGISKARVNSVHHQAIKTLGRGLIPEAISEDGLIEAIRLQPDPLDPGSSPYARGVQWHPEFQDPASDLLHRDLVLQDFLSAARQLKSLSPASVQPR